MGQIKSKALPCQKCGKDCNIRTTIKTGEDKGLKVCTFCVSKKNSQKRTSIRKTTDKTKKKNKERSERRAVFFDFHIPLCFMSEETGIRISHATRANVCHLLDKGRHPSLEAHLNNYVYLTVDEHTRFDELLFSLKFDALDLEFQNAWAMSCSRLRVLIPQCKERTKLLVALADYIGVDIT